MAGQPEESTPNLEHTDELPVLSDDAIRRLERAGAATTSTVMDELDGSVDRLRAALEHAETRWQRLETRLEMQDQAIGELKEALGQRGARAAVVPELTEIVNTAADEPAAAAGPADEAVAGQAVRAFLERIADLEAYIAGRGDRWRAMEAEVDEQNRRIAELEHELAQRVAREEALNRQLHDETARADGLREKLRGQRLQRDDGPTPEE